MSVRAKGGAQPLDDRLIAGALGAGLAALYWTGRSRSFGPGDSAQHVVSALLWGVPQAPGYPLHVELGWLWSRLPWADPGAAVNGLSGLLHAAAAAVLYLLLRRQDCRRAAALTGAGLMALAPLYWYYSLVAEVRALNDLLALGAAAVAFEWIRRGRSASWFAFCAAFGLGLSHHPTFVLLAPAYAVWLWARRPSPRLLALGAATALAALAAPYMLLGFRLARSVPAYDLPDVRGWGGLLPLYLRRNLGGPLRMVSGEGFLGFGGFDLGRLAVHLGWFAGSLWTHAGPAGLALAAVGAAALWREKRRRLLAGWLLWAGVSAGAFILVSSQQLTVCDQAYARAVVTRFHLLPLLALFALAAHGAEAAARRVRAGFANALAAAVFVLPLAARRLTLAGENPLLDYARGFVRDSAPGDIVVLTADDSVFAALDLELVRGEAGGRVFLAPSMFAYPPYVRELRRRHPDLVVPIVGGKVSDDWNLWAERNPGRAVLAESSLRDTVLGLYPASVPQGTLMRVTGTSRRSTPAEDSRRFLDAPETAEITRWNVRPWTQEVYVLESRRRMAEWVGSRLDPRKDRDLIARLKSLLASLQPPD
jgi:MYXO-CTERM domain-containing protein